MALHPNKIVNPEVFYSIRLKTIYNFIYRLSGNTKIAEGLTEKVILMYSGNQKGDLFLLKQAWENFLKSYDCVDFNEEEDTIQKSLLCIEPELRCILILRDILGYSYSQIGHIMSKSELEVGYLIAQGRQEMSKKL